MFRVYLGRNISAMKPVDKRRFGHYFCEKCHRSWKSALSWYFYGQKCKTCELVVGAYMRNYLEISQENAVDLTKKHPMEFCEKCKALDRHCFEEDLNSDDDEI